MRIGLSGAQSVGKTTLLSALRSEPVFKDFTICDEVTRRVNSYGIPINEDGNDTTQKLIMHEHLVNIYMNEDMITDRTALDGLVYTEYLYHHSRLTSDTRDYVRNVFDKIIAKYDYIFYISPEFKIVNDGVRSIDVRFRDEVANIFEAQIEKRSIPVIRVSGTVRERTSKIVDIVEGR